MHHHGLAIPGFQEAGADAIEGFNGLAALEGGGDVLGGHLSDLPSAPEPVAAIERSEQ